MNRKILGLALALSMTAALGACGGGEGGPPPAPGGESTAPKTTAPSAAPNPNKPLTPPGGSGLEKPTETKPTETKPTETKPTETKPDSKTDKPGEGKEIKPAGEAGTTPKKPK
jgi:hypothetical protein